MAVIQRTQTALSDVVAIYDYIAGENDSADAADKLLDRIEEKIQLLASNPLIGESQSHLRPNTRRVTFRKTYLIFYEPITDGILIPRVLHGMRDIDRGLFANIP